MAAPLSAAEIAELKKYATPSISNGIETFKIRPRNEGFMSHEIRCMFPEMHAYGRLRLHGEDSRRRNPHANRTSAPTVAPCWLRPAPRSSSSRTWTSRPSVRSGAR